MLGFYPRVSLGFVAGLFAACLSAVWPTASEAAEGGERSILLTPGMDYFGGDYETLKEVDLETCRDACLDDTRCRAFTFNSKAGWCFLKESASDARPFPDAVSGRVRIGQASLPPEDLAATRGAELRFLPRSEPEAARTLAARIAETTPRNQTADSMAAEARRAAANNPERAADLYAAALRLAPEERVLWLELARTAMAASPSDWQAKQTFKRDATAAAVNAYWRSAAVAERADALVVLSRTLAERDDWRPAIRALRASLALVEDASVRAEYNRLIGEHGFRVTGHEVDSDAASPRICLQFSDPLARDRGQLADFVRVTDRTDLPIEVEARQICIDGVEHGARYRIQVRAGLPASDGETLAKASDLDIFVRDRAPMVRFLGRAYVLPAGGDPAIPVVSVNTDRIDAAVYRIGDRALGSAVASGRFRQQLSTWDANRIADRSGEAIWSGYIEVKPPVESRLNREVTTSVPVGELVKDLRPGVYAMTAQAHNAAQEPEALATQWFLVSDLGLASFSGNDGLHALVRSLSSADAVAGTKLRLVALNDDILGEATTDADGHARFEPGLLRGTGGNAPAVLVAEGPDGDYGFLVLTQTPFDLSDRGVTGRPAPGPLDVYLVTERGAYRPGETVELTALVRDAKADAVPDLPITVIFKRPDGVEHGRVLVQDQGLGGYRATLDLSRAAMRGTWRAATYSDPKAPPLAEVTFLVEDFEPERLAFELESPVKTLDPEDLPEIALDARFLFGAPAAGVAVEGEVQVKPAQGLAAFPGFRFGLASEPVEPVGQPLATTRTDDQGKAEIALQLPDLPPTSRPLEADLHVRLIEGSGRPVERSLTLPIVTRAPRIGVKPLFEDAVEEGGNAGFEIILIDSANDPNGQRQPTEGLRWTLSRLTTDFQWYESDGSWKYEPIVSTQRVASGTLESGQIDAATGAARIEARVEWGGYRLSVEGPDGTALPVDLEFEAGWYVAPRAVDTPDLLKVSLDRAEYRVGETLKARIEPRFPGVALVMVIDDRLIEMRTVEVPEEGAIVELPVTRAWGPGAYVTATLYRSMDLEARRMPGRAIGLTWAGVDPGDRRLDVGLGVDSAVVIRPRQRLEFPIQVANAPAGEPVYVTLAAVDLGILNLTRYESPAPDRWYFGQRRLGMEVRDLYGQLIDRMQGVAGVVRSGGDGAMIRLEGPPPTEELVAFQSEIIRLDAQGRANVAFDIPDFNGTLRVMAMAWSEQGVGHAVEDLLVRDPVVMMASLPRFLAPEDSSRLLLELTHVDGPAGDVTLTVATEGGHVRIPADQAERILTLAQGGRTAVQIPIEAVSVGDETLSLVLRTPDGQALSKTLGIPVRSNAPAVSRNSVVDLAPGGELRLHDSAWSEMLPGTGELSVSITGAGPLDVAGLVTGLDRYPYGCTEQLTSRALPMLYLNAVATTIGLGTHAEIRERVREAIGEVLANQASNGSFGLWGTGGDDGWLDAYVADFLTRARERGYSVPDRAFDMALDNLRNRLAYVPDFTSGGEDIAYALYVLARNGRAAIGDLRYYAETKLDAFSTPMAKAQLGAGLALMGDRPRADRVFRAAVDMLEEGDDEGAWRADFGSKLRDGAAVLTLAAESATGAVDLQALARRLEQGWVNANDTSTQDDAWLLLAAYALMQGADKPQLTLAGESWSGPWFSRLGADTAVALPLIVGNAGQRPLQALVSIGGIPLTPEPAGGDGYRIERAYYDLDGRRIDPSAVTQGDRMVAVITVSADEQRQARLIVDDPLPAGFEIDNPSLIKAGDIADIAWLGLEETAEHLEFRADRFVAAVDRGPKAPTRFQLAYRLRAVSPGVFAHPAATVEDMYRPQRRAWTDTGRVEVMLPVR
ncbi:alpha-2-macroglobulin family protein [Thiocapsa bogorovii]|uniref:alpha-2-macroglobulin family protein n=1 Tax=Thiocapsa bogorovii TaxID=521689 RepID=UPI001E2C5A46|nr:alpha-2-macroglobulin family protein [Thiocapsa bogorovii]UHD17458.1 alpha-2-macroglobulin family protein [Thiocapsa bogorovii]